MPESDERLRVLYATLALPEGGHPTEESWERLACREMDPAEREKTLDHVTRCADCARVYRALDALAEGARTFDPGVPNAPARVLPFPRWALLAGLAAAAALAVVVLRPATGPRVPAAPASDGFRGAARSLDPVPLAPRGRVSGLPAELRWQGIATPTLYRVVVLDAEGEGVWSSGEVDGTALAWPAELSLKPGSYFWQVTALPKGGLPGDRRASSLIAFEVVTSSLP